MISRHAAFILQLDGLEVSQSLPQLPLRRPPKLHRGVGAVVGEAIRPSVLTFWLLAGWFPAHGRVRSPYGLIIWGASPLRLSHDYSIVFAFLFAGVVVSGYRPVDGSFLLQQRLQSGAVGISERFSPLSTCLQAVVSSPGLTIVMFVTRTLVWRLHRGGELQTLRSKMLLRPLMMLSTAAAIASKHGAQDWREGRYVNQKDEGYCRIIRPFKNKVVEAASWPTCRFD